MPRTKITKIYHFILASSQPSNGEPTREFYTFSDAIWLFSFRKTGNLPVRSMYSTHFSINKGMGLSGVTKF